MRWFVFLEKKHKPTHSSSFNNVNASTHGSTAGRCCRTQMWRQGLVIKSICTSKQIPTVYSISHQLTLSHIIPHHPTSSHTIPLHSTSFHYFLHHSKVLHKISLCYTSSHNNTQYSTSSSHSNTQHSTSSSHNNTQHSTLL